MELKEYYKIWRSQMSIIIYTILISVVVVYAWSVKESEKYLTSFLVSIGRVESQNTADYKYDQFYRLQADEKFAEIITGWLKSPGVSAEIFKKADINSENKSLRQLSKSFRAEKISADSVSVNFSASNEEEAKKIANTTSAIILEKTKDLNNDALDPNWFKTETSNLIILKNVQDLRVNLFLAALAGIFFGTFFAFGKHYILE